MEDLDFQTINGIPAENIAVDGPPGITLRGDIIFKEPVDVLGNLTVYSRKVNDIVLEDEIVTPNKLYNGVFYLYFVTECF